MSEQMYDQQDGQLHERNKAVTCKREQVKLYSNYIKAIPL